MKKVIILGICLLCVWILFEVVSDNIFPTQIAHVYLDAIDVNDTAFIILKHPPKNNKAMLSFWTKNKHMIAEKYHISPSHFKSIIFLKNAYEKYNHHTEDQFCFSKNVKEKSCIDKNEAILIVHQLTGGSYSFSFSQPNCSLIENGKGRCLL